MSAEHALIELLHQTGCVASASPRLTPLTGGVSSEIYLVEDGERRFVLKRALEKLRVREDWFADISRNRAEQAYLRYVGEFLPAAVPRVIVNRPEHGFFTMEYLGHGFTPWKQRLLDRDDHPLHAHHAGWTLGTIHAHSFGQLHLAGQFNRMENFRQLRLDPYLQRTAERHPDLAALLRAEINRLAATRDCLVHGDYSPKNILVSADRLVVLDCEVACFGDAVFDTAFLLNHLFLKSLHHHPGTFDLTGLVSGFWNAYLDARGPNADRTLTTRTLRLLPMLMLARVDGKSPAEYLTQPVKQQFIRDFARPAILQPEESLAVFTARWSAALQALPLSLT